MYVDDNVYFQGWTFPHSSSLLQLRKDSNYPSRAFGINFTVSRYRKLTGNHPIAIIMCVIYNYVCKLTIVLLYSGIPLFQLPYWKIYRVWDTERYL